MSSHQRESPINVLFLAAEASPLVKVGGLGDVAGSLPPALRRLPEQTLDVRLALPFHGAIRKEVKNPELVAEFDINRSGMLIPTRVYVTAVDDLPVYLIEGSPIPADGAVYDGANPSVDGEKYVFFSLASLQLIQHLDWKPDILHANDWHTAASVYALTLQKKSDKSLEPLHSVLTVHNLPFMGKGAEKAMMAYGLPRSRSRLLPRWAVGFPLPLGMLTTDKIVAVSPGYAEEIQTPEFGCGLQDFLSSRKNKITGIFNGLDRKQWDPAHDGCLQTNYDAGNLPARQVNKSALQGECDLPLNPSIPLLVIVSRMDQQKGIDIAIDGMRQAAGLDWQAVILGTGDSLLESACRSLEAEFPDRVRALIRFDSDLSHRLYAGGDILLMPSRYEPCGLAQMIAMNYGCVPLARATGGLKDTIIDDPTLANSTGFLFDEPAPTAFSAALERALFTYQEKPTWRKIQLRGMQTDFGWEKPAAQYANLYHNLMGGGK